MLGLSRELLYSIIIVSMLSFLLIHALAVADDGEFEVSNAYWTDENGRRTSVTEGDTVYLTLEIRQSNPSNIKYKQDSTYVDLGRPPVAVSGLTVELLGGDWFEIVGDSRYDVQTAVPVGNVFIANFKVKIKENVSPGNYSGRVRISYTLAYDGSRWYTVNQSEIDYFNISVKGRPSLKAKINGTVISGETTNITIILRNEGDAGIRDAEASLSTQLPLDIEPESMRIGCIGPGEEKKLSFSVTAPYNFQSSSVSFTVTLTYTDPEGNDARSQWNLQLISTSPPRNYPLLQLSLNTPGELIPNIEMRGLLIIANKGEGEALDLNLQVFSQMIQVNPQSLPVIDELGPNQTVVYPLVLKASKVAGSSPATIEVRGFYQDNSGRILQIDDYFTVPVKPESEYKPILITRILPGLIVDPGVKNNLTLVIENMGPFPVYNVSLTAMATQASVEAPVKYVEVISPGEKASIPLYLVAPVSLSGGVTELSLEIMYNDISGAPSLKRDTYTLKVAEKTGKPLIVARLLGTPEMPLGVNREFLELKNMGDGRAFNIILKLNSQGGLSVLNNSTIYIDSLEPSESIVYPVLISGELQGSYTITMTIRYEDEWGRVYIDTYSQGVKIFSSPETSINIFLLDKEIPVGRQSNITFLIQAVNGNASDLWVTVSSHTLSILGSPVRHLSQLADGANAMVSFMIYAPDSLAGKPADIELKLEYITERGARKLDTYQLSVLASGEVELELLDYSTYPSELHPGEEFGLTVSIVNKGSDKARQVTCYVTETGGLILLGGNKTFIGDAGIDSIIPVSYSFKIPSNTTPGLRDITVKLSYKDSFNRAHFYKVVIPVNISSAPAVQENSHKFPTTVLFVAGILVVTVSAVFVWKRFKKG